VAFVKLDLMKNPPQTRAETRPGAVTAQATIAVQVSALCGGAKPR